MCLIVRHDDEDPAPRPARPRSRRDSHQSRRSISRGYATSRKGSMDSMDSMPDTPPPRYRHSRRSSHHDPQQYFDPSHASRTSYDRRYSTDHTDERFSPRDHSEAAGSPFASYRATQGRRRSEQLPIVAVARTASVPKSARVRASRQETQNAQSSNPTVDIDDPQDDCFVNTRQFPDSIKADVSRQQADWEREGRPPARVDEDQSEMARLLQQRNPKKLHDTIQNLGGESASHFEGYQDGNTTVWMTHGTIQGGSREDAKVSFHRQDTYRATEGHTMKEMDVSATWKDESRFRFLGTGRSTCRETTVKHRRGGTLTKWVMEGVRSYKLPSGKTNTQKWKAEASDY